MKIPNDFEIKRLMKMKINRILVDGFCNLENIVIDIHDIAVFISSNNYGKSNVLTALRFGFDFMTSDSDSMRNSMMKYQPAIPICVDNPRTAFSFGIEGEITNEEDKATHQIKYNYTFQWIGKQERSITNEHLQIKELNTIKPRYRDYIVRDDYYEAKYLKTVTGRCSTKIKLKPSELAIRKMLAYDELFYNDIISRISSVSVQVQEHFDAKPEASSILALYRNEEPELSFENITHLPRYLYFMNQFYNDDYLRLIDSFKQLIPDIEDVETIKLDAKKKVKKKVVSYFLGDNEEEHQEEMNEDDDDPFVFDDSLYQLFIHYRHLNQPIEIRRMSDGTCRVLLILTAAVNAHIQKLSLICFEELENCIHPRLFHDLLNIVLQLAGDCKVIFTSHSPYMVRYVSLDRIYIGIPNNQGKGIFATLTVRGQNTVIKDSEELELSTGEYIFEALAGDEDALEVINSNTQVGAW